MRTFDEMIEDAPSIEEYRCMCAYDEAYAKAQEEAPECCADCQSFDMDEEGGPLCKKLDGPTPETEFGCPKSRTEHKKKLRLSITGVSGCGKTFLSLQINQSTKKAAVVYIRRP